MSGAVAVPPGEDALLAGVRRRRLLAWLVDLMLIAILAGSTVLTLVAMGFLTFGLTWGLLGWVPAIPLLYHWLWVASPASATPGQMLMGLIVRRDEDLGPPGVLRAAVATLGYLVTIATGAVWFAVCLVTVHKRCLHDIVSGLVLVRRHPPAAWRFPE
jgi:uncharacterized RDD family membrane protein YckC